MLECAKKSMKKIVQYFLMTVALGVPGTVQAQDEAEPVSAESAPAQPEEDALTAQRKRFEDIEKQAAELKEPSRTFTSRYERMKAEAERSNKRIDEQLQKVKASEEKLEEISRGSFLFEVVRESEREQYAQEGAEMVQKVTKLLNGKDTEQIEGVAGFEALYENYQGIPGYVAAHDQYRNVLDRFERKWTAARDKAQRDRQKLTGSARTKADDAEQSLYRRTAKKMSGLNKDIEKDWFAPSGNMMSNMLLLDLLLQKVRTAKRMASSEPEDDAEKLPDMIKAYWDEMDIVVQKLQTGAPDQGTEMLNESKSFDAIMAARHRSIPEKYKKLIREQHNKLRDELRRSSSALRQAKRDLERDKNTLESDISRLGSYLDAMQSALDTEHEALERKAAEEAERKAEQEEAAREAAAEEGAEDDSAKDDSAKDDKSTAKKKKRKKSAEKKGKE